MPWPIDCVRQNEPLANHTSIRIGGPAEWFAQPQSIDALLEVLAEAERLQLPVHVLGGGTNTLVPDRGIRGLVIHLADGFRSLAELHSEKSSEVIIRCGAAMHSQQLVTQAARKGWGGFEWLAGLPGQIGGAVVMNAQNIGSSVKCIRMVTLDGNVIEIPGESLNFAYRYSELPKGIIVEVDLMAPRVAPEMAASDIRVKLDKRNATQDLQFPSSGCAFRNPPGDSAGRLIDAAGLKGARIGDAQLSMVHANFIVNVGCAKADDVLALIEYVRQEIFSEFGIQLEPEVRMIGEALYAINSA